MVNNYITPGQLSRIDANWQYDRKLAIPTELQLTRDINQHDGYASTTPLNGSEGIGSTSGPKTSTVERAALGAHAHLDSQRASVRYDIELLDIVAARLAATIKAILEAGDPPATCNGGLGRDDAIEWAGVVQDDGRIALAPCTNVATRGGLCDKHRMRERRYRSDNGLESREDTQ